jgi:hypothetical protein
MTAHVYSLPPGGSIHDWERHEELPGHVNDDASLHGYLRNIALTGKGREAYRVQTDDGDILGTFSTHDLFSEMTGRSVITIAPVDQVYVFFARALLCIPIAAA